MEGTKPLAKSPADRSRQRLGEILPMGDYVRFKILGSWEIFQDLGVGGDIEVVEIGCLDNQTSIGTEWEVF